MNEKEPLDKFLSQFNRKEKWARVFSFAMTALGLFVVVGLIILTAWGFSSYGAADRMLSLTQEELADTQQRVGELETIAHSNVKTSELMELRDKLTSVQQLVTARENEIAALRKQLENNGSPAPSLEPAPPANCTKCEAELDQRGRRIKALLEENKSLKDRLNNCPELIRRCRSSAPGSNVINE